MDLDMDLRGMAPPGPMVAILKRMAEAPDQPFVALLPHVPWPLLPEIEERGWRYDIMPDPSGECRLRLSPPGSP
jgi:hypothetical protein